MARVIGCLAAFAALAAGVIAGLDPVTNLTHAAIALFVGWAAACVWQALMASTSAFMLPADTETELEKEEIDADKQQAA